MKKRDVHLNTEAHREAFNQFVEAMVEAEHAEGWRSSDVLRNWLDASFRALRGAMLKLHNNGDFEINEKEYMAIVARCRKPDITMNALSTMLGACSLALIKEPLDFIGPVFTKLSSDSGMGQFFTPFEVSKLMAGMIIGEVAAELKDRPHLMLCEPACGVGGMVLAANVVLREKGFNIARQAHWHATDIDYRAMCGCYIQLALTDTSAVVFHGNSLSSEPFNIATATPAAYLYPKKREWSGKYDADTETPDRPREQPRLTATQAANLPPQLDLFGEPK